MAVKFHTLVEAVAHWAEHAPDKVCLIDADSDRRITYGEFWRLIRVFARRLRAAGLRQGGRVVVRVGPLLETLAAQFGVYLAGGVYCPVEKHMKELKILEMLDYFDSRLLVSSERVVYRGQWIDLASVCGDGEPLDGFAFPNPEAMCAVIFTTGTTGRAKGVMLSYKAILAAAEAWAALFGLTREEVFFCANPLDRVAGLRLACMPFLAGATAVHQTGFIFISEFFNNLGRYQVTGLNIQSFALGLIVKAAPRVFAQYKKQLRFMFFSAGSMPERHMQGLCSLLPETKLYMHYGATEITTIARYEFSAHQPKAHCLGTAYPGTEIRLLDSAGAPAAAASSRNPGIVACRNGSMMLGYWKDPALTQKTIVDGYIVMTDMGYIGGDGYLYLMGRRDDVIVSGGHKIAPYEIEQVAARLSEIAECVCVPRKDPVLGAVPALFVVMKEGAEFSAKKIFKYLSERIESCKMPRIIQEMDEMPRVPGSFKISRKALYE